jgi:hypothetical protein
VVVVYDPSHTAIAALDAQSGKRVWSWPLLRRNVSTFCGGDGWALMRAYSPMGTLQARSLPAGRTLWTAELRGLSTIESTGSGVLGTYDLPRGGEGVFFIEIAGEGAATP